MPDDTAGATPATDEDVAEWCASAREAVTDRDGTVYYDQSWTLRLAARLDAQTAEIARLKMELDAERDAKEQAGLHLVAARPLIREAQAITQHAIALQARLDAVRALCDEYSGSIEVAVPIRNLCAILDAPAKEQT